VKNANRRTEQRSIIDLKSAVNGTILQTQLDTFFAVQQSRKVSEFLTEVGRQEVK